MTNIEKIREELADILKDPDITDRNGCPCCLPLVYAEVNSVRLIGLAELAGVDREAIERFEKRCDAESDRNYAWLYRNRGDVQHNDPQKPVPPNSTL